MSCRVRRSSTHRSTSDNRHLGVPTQAVVLSVQSPAPESVFAVVFAVVSLGAVALTLNVLLLARRGSTRPLAVCRFAVD